MFSVALTGGIGSGKSRVADLFAAAGVAIVDTDVIAHALTAPDGAAIPAIRALFGDQALRADGAMNRVRVRQMVFSDLEAKRRLEAVLHPMIRQQCEQAVARISTEAQAPYLIRVIPLLAEAGSPYRRSTDRVLVVDCPASTRIERVIRRSNLLRDEVENIIASQASDAQRRALADDVIDNGGDWEATAHQVAILHQRYLQLAKKGDTL